MLAKKIRPVQVLLKTGCFLIWNDPSLNVPRPSHVHPPQERILNSLYSAWHSIENFPKHLISGLPRIVGINGESGGVDKQVPEPEPWLEASIRMDRDDSEDHNDEFF